MIPEPRRERSSGVIKITFEHTQENYLFFCIVNFNRGHLFSTYSKFSEKKLLFLTSWYARAYQKVRNVSFSENFAYVLNELLSHSYSININTIPTERHLGN